MPGQRSITTGFSAAGLAALKTATAANVKPIVRKVIMVRDSSLGRAGRKRISAGCACMIFCQRGPGKGKTAPRTENEAMAPGPRGEQPTAPYDAGASPRTPRSIFLVAPLTLPLRPVIPGKTTGYYIVIGAECLPCDVRPDPPSR